MFEISNEPSPAIINDRDFGQPFSPAPKYPFAALEVGQVFSVPSVDKRTDKRRWDSLRASCRQWNAKTGKDFKPSKVEGGMQVWRVA